MRLLCGCDAYLNEVGLHLHEQFVDGHASIDFQFRQLDSTITLHRI